MKGRYLRRYTDIPALFYLLRERKITLLDPEDWDDSNDSHYLALYRERKKLKSVLALCFTRADEMYHHWRTFASGSGGVCVRFKRTELLKAIGNESGLRTQAVTYLTLSKGRNRSMATQDLPFLKRHAFRDEREVRIIYESKIAKTATLDITIPLSSIDRVTLSPWIRPALFQHVKQMLRTIEGCSTLKIVRSTLIDNREWKRLGKAVSQRDALAGRKSAARKLARR